MQKGWSDELGQEKIKHKEEVNGGTQDTGGCKPKEVVQGKMGRCPIWQALRTTKGRKARNALLQTIKACYSQNPCYCFRAYYRTKEEACCSEEETRSTQGEAKKSIPSKKKS